MTAAPSPAAPPELVEVALGKLESILAGYPDAWHGGCFEALNELRATLPLIEARAKREQREVDAGIAEAHRDLSDSDSPSVKPFRRASTRIALAIRKEPT